MHGHLRQVGRRRVDVKSLIHPGKEWKLSACPSDSLIHEIQEAIPCKRPFAVLLAQRGAHKWEALMNPCSRDFHCSSLMLGVEKAVSRLIQAIGKKEKIFIHGDFDVDGLSGAAVLYKGLLPLFPQRTIKVEVGTREQGHGLSVGFVRRVISELFSLVLTVDCGISNGKEISELRDAGIDTIITDHHLPGRQLPPAVAILDPHQAGETYPNCDLAGVGVAYKLICGLYKQLGREVPYSFLDLVGLGTIADLVPLARGSEVENRAIVREALSLLASGTGSSLGLRVLMDRMSVNVTRVTARDIAYIVVPKLNAANRAGDPKVAFLLLCTGKQERARYLTEILLDYNRDREIAQDDLLAQAEEKIAAEGTDPAKDGIVVLTGKYWNEGILGLAASRLVDRYHVPAVVISRGDRMSRASCRSIEGFDMVECLEAHSDLLIRYGGHKMAAGFSVSNDLLPILRKRLLLYATEKNLAPLSTANSIDVELVADGIDIQLYTNLHSLAPYGQGNPLPIFLLRGCSFDGLSLVGARKQHLKGRVVCDGSRVPFIAFRMARHINTFENTCNVAVVFRAGFDSWHKQVQLEVIDLVEN